MVVRKHGSVHERHKIFCTSWRRGRGIPKETLQRSKDFSSLILWAEVSAIAKHRDRWKDYEREILMQYSTRVSHHSTSGQTN